MPLLQRYNTMNISGICVMTNIPYVGDVRLRNLPAKARLHLDEV